MKKTILIIEDEDPIIELLRVNLESAGYRVIITKDGEAGLKKALSDIPDIVILDIRLPKLNGYEVCGQLKNNSTTKKIPVIFLSASAQRDCIEKCKSIGGDRFLKKPFDITELIEIIKCL